MRKSLFILLMLFLSFSSGFAGDDAVTLLTEEEGAMREALPGFYELSRALNDGPEIQIITPKSNNEYKAPLKVSILFIPNENNDVDLSKLKVECLKFITINITKRILPFATKEGINIENAELPKGKHKIRVTVGDSKGGITKEVFIAKII